MVLFIILFTPVNLETRAYDSYLKDNFSIKKRKRVREKSISVPLTNPSAHTLIPDILDRRGVRSKLHDRDYFRPIQEKTRLSRPLAVSNIYVYVNYFKTYSL